MRKRVIGGLLLLLSAGCSVNDRFVYKPTPIAADVERLPFGIAVLPFADGTEDFVRRGSVFEPESLFFNLAKGGIDGHITALTPELWAKSFAEELAASGRFRSVRFVYARSELADEEFRIDGVLEKMTAAAAFTRENEVAVLVRAVRASDDRAVWEARFERRWKTSPQLYDGCGALDKACMNERGHASTNRLMQSILSEAGAALAAKLPTLAGRGESPPGTSSDPLPAPGSAESDIERILKGN
ncbi:MAG TPA: hypothetical protein VIU29_09425 [Candidatus Deferrimicrobiaceae bacterium]